MKFSHSSCINLPFSHFNIWSKQKRGMQMSILLSWMQGLFEPLKSNKTWENSKMMSTWNKRFTYSWELWSARVYLGSNWSRWTSKALIQKRYSIKNRKQLNPELNEIHGQNNWITAKKHFMLFKQQSAGGRHFTHHPHNTKLGCHFCHLCLQKTSMCWQVESKQCPVDSSDFGQAPLD